MVVSGCQSRAVRLVRSVVNANVNAKASKMFTSGSRVLLLISVGLKVGPFPRVLSACILRFLSSIVLDRATVSPLYSVVKQCFLTRSEVLLLQPFQWQISVAQVAKK